MEPCAMVMRWSAPLQDPTERSTTDEKARPLRCRPRHRAGLVLLPGDRVSAVQHRLSDDIRQVYLSLLHGPPQRRRVLQQLESGGRLLVRMSQSSRALPDSAGTERTSLVVFADHEEVAVVLRQDLAIAGDGE